MTNEVEDVQARTMVSHAFLMERFDELGRFGITPCHCIPSLPWAKLSETLSQIMKMDHPVLDARGIWSALMETFEKVELSSVIHSGMQSDFLPEAQREKIVIAYDELSPSFQPPARAAYYSGIHQALPLLLTALHGTEEALSGFSLEDLKLWAGNGGNERDDPLRYPHPVVGWDAVYEVLRCSLQSYNKLDGILTTPSPNLSVVGQGEDRSILQETHDTLEEALSNGRNAAVVRLLRCAQRAHSLVQSTSEVFIRNGTPDICCTCGLTADVSAVSLTLAGPR